MRTEICSECGIALTAEEIARGHKICVWHEAGKLVALRNAARKAGDAEFHADCNERFRALASELRVGTVAR